MVLYCINTVRRTYANEKNRLSADPVRFSVPNVCFCAQRCKLSCVEWRRSCFKQLLCQPGRADASAGIRSHRSIFHANRRHASALLLRHDGAEQNYLELYLLLPASLSAGDLFSSDVAAQANSITLYEVSQNGDDMYFAGQFVGVAYPDNSRYEIRIDQADRSADTLSLRGTLSATLCYFDASGQPTGQTLSLSDGQFHLELPIDSAVVAATPQPSAAPESSEAPLPDLPSSTPDVATPRPTLDPHPAFTLPPDYRIV